MQFVKIFDKETAQELIESGFSYMLEKQNNQDVYVFPMDSKLMSLFQTKFSVQPEFACETKLRF